VRESPNCTSDPIFHLLTVTFLILSQLSQQRFTRLEMALIIWSKVASDRAHLPTIRYFVNTIAMRAWLLRSACLVALLVVMVISTHRTEVGGMNENRQHKSFKILVD
jgi:hypothetical protein